jgi:hypothetical protein
MNYTLYHLVGAVCLGGTIGGVVNTMLAGPLTTPSWKNVFIGTVAGFIAWLPNLANFAGVGHSIGPVDMIGACGSTIFVGISGAKWITSHADLQKLEDDKIQLKGALVQAATKAPDVVAAQRLAGANKVAEMVDIVKSLKDS